MPQVYMILAPGVKNDLGIGLIREMGTALIKLVEQMLGIEGKEDVAFTAVEAIVTKNEAPIQIEIRYTAGKDEYGRGKPFDPSEGRQKFLAKHIVEAIKTLISGKFKCSVWFKPYHKSVFETEM